MFLFIGKLKFLLFISSSLREIQAGGRSCAMQLIKKVAERRSDKIYVAGESFALLCIYVTACVRPYKYFGCWLNDAWDYSQEIKARIVQARGSLLCQRDLALNLRLRIVGVMFSPFFFYGLEGWILIKTLEGKLAAFEMWLCRRIFRGPWTDGVRNTKVLTRMCKEMEVLFEVKWRKLKIFRPCVAQ